MDNSAEYIDALREKLEDYLITEDINNVRVSIIVPCYNTEKYIEKSLDSLIRQMLEDIEIICIDDGSTDSTPEILKAYSSIDKRIKIITQTNQKQGSARNRGIEIARGEYIGFCDSDDWVVRNYYKKLYDTAEKYNADIAIADYVRIGNGKTKKRLNINRKELCSDLEDKFNICKQAKHPCPTNKIYKTDLLRRENIKFSEGGYCEDKIFTCKAVYYANRVVSVPDTYYYYYRRSDSTVITKNQKYVQDKINANKDVLNFLREQNVELKKDDFWAIKKDFTKFGICWYLIKENLTTEKHLLFGFIPIKKYKLNNSRLINHRKKVEFKKLSKKKFDISPYYSNNYNEPTKMDLYTVTFNNPKIVEYQIKLIKKNLQGSYCHIICDNSNNEGASRKIKEICEKNDITFFRVQIGAPSGYSDSHGRALNWIYKNLIQKRQNDFGFIDHDIFPIKKFNIEDYLKDNDLFGFIRTANKIWFLWPTFSFFRYSLLKDKKVNFRKYRFLKFFHYNGADSGSGLWTSIYSKYDINKIPKLVWRHVDIINKTEPDLSQMVTGHEPYIQTNVSQYMDNNRWFHSLCGSEWRDDVKKKNEIIYKMLDDYLNEKSLDNSEIIIDEDENKIFIGQNRNITGTWVFNENK